ncbi:MAG: hypothetical protein Q4F65_02865 [Propionibacteriaceae bacterium]|nr:hypothetical protein [Propionibacteriaceae bacterium]
MATWTDGPEYAPLTRPDVFVVPDAAPALTTDEPDAPADVPAVPDAGGRPDYTAPDALPLDATVPADADAPSRDPKEAFDVAATPVTSWTSTAASPSALSAQSPSAQSPSPHGMPAPEGEPVPLDPPPAPSANPSAWGHAHAPHWPEQQQAWPEPQQPAWPAHQQAWPEQQPQGPQPVTLSTLTRATTPGVLISLGIGALVAPLSLPLLMVASVLGSRVRYRRSLIGRLYSGAIAGSLVLALLGQFLTRGTLDAFSWFAAASDWARLGCLVLLVVIPLVVWDALRRNERPEELP